MFLMWIKRSLNSTTAPAHKKTLKNGMQSLAQHHLGNERPATSILIPFHSAAGMVLRPVPVGLGLVPQFQPDPPCLTSWGCFHAQSQWKHPRSCSNIWRLNWLTLFIHLRLIQTRFLDKCCYKWIKKTTKCKEGPKGSHLLLTNSAQM